MKTREEVLVLFRDKYRYLKSVYPAVGPFDESKLLQNPDEGWQIDLGQCELEIWATITLRPGANAPHETHGAICARWYREGAAFNDGIRGHLGYPISDEEGWVIAVQPPCPYGYPLPWDPPATIPVHQARSAFQFGTITYDEGLSWETIKSYAPRIYSEVFDTMKLKALDDNYFLIGHRAEEDWKKSHDEIASHWDEVSRHYAETGELPSSLVALGARHQTLVIKNDR